MRDENKTEHMVDIMAEMQQYLPMVDTVKDYHVSSLATTVQVATAQAHLIPFAGDRKTMARARGAQKSCTKCLLQPDCLGWCLL